MNLKSISQPNTEGDLTYVTILKIFDKNMDSVITLDEYLSILDSSRDRNDEDVEMKAMLDKPIDYTTHDGVKKQIPLKDLFSLPNFDDHGLKYENGQILQEKSGVESVHKLKQSNPQVDYIVKLGKWAHSMLMSSGYGYGMLVSARSSPVRESKFKENGDFEVTQRY